MRQFGSLPKEGESIFTTPERRAWADYKIDADTGCWVWQKRLTAQGYPQRAVHRLYFQAANPEIEMDGLHVHHVCKNRACLNPEHLEGVAPREHFKHHFLGERCGGLTVEQVQEIVELGRTNATSHEVGRRFGISEATVRDYWRGRRWAPETGVGGVTDIRPLNRTCEHCGGPIGPERKRGVVYCTESCKRSAKWVRDRTRREEAA